MSDQLTPFVDWLTLPQPEPGDPQERVGDSSFPPDYFQVETPAETKDFASRNKEKEHPGELRSLVLRNLVDFLDVRLKHMAGRHNQKRHGWRYSRGSGHAGIGEEGFHRAVEITLGPTERHLDEAKRIVAASISMRRTPEPGERMEYRKRAGIVSPPPKLAKPKPEMPKPVAAAPKVSKPTAAAPAGPTVDIPYRPSLDTQREIYKSHDEWLIANGVSKKDLPATRRALEQDLQRICDENPLVVRAPGSAAENIIREGRFKSQFESGTSEGSYSPDLRSDAERNGLGVPSSIARSKRPIYGYLRGAATDDGARWYGEVVFYMKPVVRSRATVTVDDSLGNFSAGWQIGTPLVKPNLGSLRRSSTSSTFGNYIEKRRVGSKTEFTISRGKPSYFEVQIHQGVGLKDVGSVHFTQNCFSGSELRPKYAAMETVLKSKGIEVIYELDSY